MAKKKSTQSKSLAAARDQRATALAHDLLQARGAVQTAILALEGKGVFNQVAMMLRISVLQPIERIQAEVANG